MNYTSIESLYKIFLQSSSITTDTRAITSGSLFFALKGDKFNGNEFAAQALEKGSSYVIVDEEKYCTSEKYLLVKDVLVCLQQLAKYHRGKLKIPVL
jgi:UDP-N-acetylmuramoyl-tripeptide--D-alanyl-D-alanine ligase